MSDLYPNLEAANTINSQNDSPLSYLTDSVDASDIGKEQKGLRTLVCSLHHMSPQIAKDILKNAQDAHQPFCALEISDNSFPKLIWWIAMPINIIMTFLVTPMVRPVSAQQLLFTYLIPILPLFIAWDGAVSNARTYTLKDLDILLEDLGSESYKWEKGIINGKSKKRYLLGLPQ